MKTAFFTIIHMYFLCAIIKNVISIGHPEGIQSYVTKNTKQLNTVSEIRTDSYTSFHDLFKNLVGITEPYCVLVVFYDEKDGNFDWIDSILSLKHPTTVSQ